MPEKRGLCSPRQTRPRHTTSQRGAEESSAGRKAQNCKDHPYLPSLLCNAVLTQGTTLSRVDTIGVPWDAVTGAQGCLCA